jgi:hypothetical protein
VPHVFMYLLKYIRVCLNRLSLPLTGIYLSTYLPTCLLSMHPTTSLTHMNHARGWVWFLVVVVLRALGREREGAWVWVGWYSRFLPTMLQHDGRCNSASTPAGRVSHPLCSAYRHGVRGKGRRGPGFLRVGDNIICVCVLHIRQ